MPTTGPGQSGQPPKKRVRFRNDEHFVQVRMYAPNPEEWTASDVQSHPLLQMISCGNNIRAEERKREKYPKKDETDGWRLISVDDAIQRAEPGQNSVARAIETERCANIVGECWENRMSVAEVEPLDEENGTNGADEWFRETKIIPLELVPADDDDDDEQMQQAEFVESVADGCGEVAAPGLFVDSSGEDMENEVVSSATPQHTQQEHSLVELTELSPSRRARPTATTALTLSPQKANSNGQDERPAVLEVRQISPTSVRSSPLREVCPTTQSPSKALLRSAFVDSKGTEWQWLADISEMRDLDRVCRANCLGRSGPFDLCSNAHFGCRTAKKSKAKAGYRVCKYRALYSHKRRAIFHRLKHNFH